MDKDYRRLVKAYIFSPEEIGAKQFMEIYDMCFKLCLEGREKDIFRFMCANFMELRDQLDRSTPEEELRSYVLYRTKVQFIQRSVAYMHRFWVPNERNQAKTVTVKSQEIPIDDLYKTLMGLWGEAPSLEELE